MKRSKKYPVLNELKGKMREHEKTYRLLSNEIDISVNAINAKVNGYSPVDSDDVVLFSRALNIKHDEIAKYFFPQLLRFEANKL